MSLVVNSLGYLAGVIHLTWVLGLFGFLIYRFTDYKSDFFERIETFLVDRFRELSLVLVTAATSGSLYISEILGVQPCPLCWYQRIFMYPLTLLFLISLVLMKKDVKLYALPLTLIGSAIALFHYAVQLFGEFSLNCSTAIPCSEMHVEVFGYISVPLMAFTVFTTVMALNYLSYREA
jgi:disulfide bond formation protein DsbB